jgi:hypothetical protein
MNNTPVDEKSLKELESKLENASDIETAKQFALNAIHPECRTIANDFFNCVEDKLKPYEKPDNKLSLQKLEEDMNNMIIPSCLRAYDIDSCLKKFEKI